MKANIPHTLAEMQAAAAWQGLTVQERHGRYRVVRKFSLSEPAIEWVEVVAGEGFSLSLDAVRNLLISGDAERDRMMTGLHRAA